VPASISQVMHRARYYLDGLSATLAPESTPDKIIQTTPTSAPAVNLELVRRASSGTSSGWNSNVCGWELGDFTKHSKNTPLYLIFTVTDSVWRCPGGTGGTSTCSWNSNLKVIGCGTNSKIMPHVTSCVDFNATTCDAACSANPSILKWYETSPLLY
jgi:hypothetical protein